MVEIIHGDIFESPEENYLVNPVNTVGVMGKGLAREFKDRYIKEYYVYLQNYSYMKGGDILQTGKIIQAATKEHWLHNSELSWVQACLWKIRLFAEQHKVQVSLPLLGCGEGKLNELDVRELIDEILGPSEAKFTLYIK